MAIMLNQGQHPFVVKGEPEQEIKNKIRNRKFDLEKIKCSASAKDLLSKLLCPKAARLTANEALYHPWVTKRKQNFAGETLNKMFNAEKKIAKTLAMMMFYSYCRSKTDMNFLARKTPAGQMVDTELGLNWDSAKKRNVTLKESIERSVSPKNETLYSASRNQDFRSVQKTTASKKLSQSLYRDPQDSRN